MVKVQSVDKARQQAKRDENQDSTPLRKIWADIAANYPQYTLKEASKLSSRDIILLLKAKQKQRAEIYLNLVQIAAAPHTEKGELVNTLTEQYRSLIN